MLKIARLNRLTMLALCVTLLFTANARAQGTSKLLPDPISMAEFSRSLDLYVHPSKEQTAAIETLHDAYKERFRALRDGDIDQFLKKVREKWNNGHPQKADVDDFVKALDHANRQIAEVDDSLFEALATMAGEERQAGVQRARDARSRIRSCVRFNNFDQAYLSTDLSVIIFGMQLPKEELQKIDPLLADYEPRLTAAMKDVAKADLQWFRDRYFARDNANIPQVTPEEQNDPAKLWAAHDAARPAIDKAYEPCRLKCEKVAQLNNATCKALVQQLSDNYKKTLRSQYVMKAYYRMQGMYSSFDLMLRTDVLFRKALRSKSLDEAAKAQITDAYHKWRDADDAIVDQGIRTLDENRSARDPENMRNDNEHEVGTEIDMKRNDLAFESLKSVSSLVDNPKLKALFEKNPAERSGAIIMDGMIDKYVDAPEPEERQPYQNPRDVAERSPVSDEIIKAIAAQLSLGDAQKALLETVHSDYKTRWDEAITPTLQKLDAGGKEAYAIDKATGRIIPNQDRVIESIAVRKVLFNQGSDLDAAFMDDLATLLGENADAALRLAKLERALDRTANEEFGTLGSSIFLREHPVNIVKLLRSSDLPAETQAKALKALVVQSDAIAQSLLDSYRTSLDLKAENEQKFSSRIGNQSGKVKMDKAEMDNFMAGVKVLHGKFHALKLGHNDAIHRGWTAALEPLDDTHRAALQMSFDELAYEDLFRDDVGSLWIVQSALKLKDLTDEQQTQLQTLKQTTRDKLYALSRTLIPDASKPVPEINTREDHVTRQELSNMKSKVKFDRGEVNQQTVRQLRKILTEEQAGRIRGLMDYEKTAARIAEANKRFSD